MEKRVVIATVVCALIFILYTAVIMPLLHPPQPRTPPATTTAPAPQTGTAPTPTKDEPKPAPTPVDGVKETKVDVETPHHLTNKHIDVVLTSRGAAVRSLALLAQDLRKSQESEEPYQLLTADRPSAMTTTVRGDKGGIDAKNWETVAKNDASITYAYQTSTGVKITKTFSIDPEKPILHGKIAIANVGARETENVALDIATFPAIDIDSPYRIEGYLSGFIGTLREVWQVDYYRLGGGEVTAGTPIPIESGRQTWHGVKNRYFAAIFMPATRDIVTAHRFTTSLIASKEPGVASIPTLSCWAQTAVLPVIKGSPVELQYDLYAGPISKEALDPVGNGTTLLVDYTAFDFVGEAILWILNLFYSIAGNYGVAIILTTIAVRLIMFPLSKKQQISIYKMQILKPKLDAIRERYKGDQQKATMEQMKLFKEHGVSPFGGCLPLLIQLPIFIGMYSVLDISIDLRQSAFFLWIRDLSQPDTLIHFSSSFLGVSTLNVLPIVMTVTWVIQALLMPRSPDPQAAMQQKIMLFMPLLFGIMCYNLASGLSLYFFTNSLVGIFEQKFIKKVYGLGASPAADAATSAPMKK